MPSQERWLRHAAAAEVRGPPADDEDEEEATVVGSGQTPLTSVSKRNLCGYRFE